jgi:hypothetical protein
MMPEGRPIVRLLYDHAGRVVAWLIRGHDLMNRRHDLCGTEAGNDVVWRTPRKRAS